jgi:hypothetical protein
MSGGPCTGKPECTAEQHMYMCTSTARREAYERVMGAGGQGVEQERDADTEGQAAG